ncbi:head maturation protease, ClpP-related [Chachezhania sediminis]|uniref:head maturation protease, ClpP-related n=1 Tax=Chachezhania sediminis TaxID=2599291 RepID=UPI00131B60D4|nr:head maturation protease, ClpP-related [Chachezhania sediminis]
MANRFDLSGEIRTGRAKALARFLGDCPGPVTLVINSPGGDAMEGAAMMAEVQRHGQVTVLVQGVCASAATLPMVSARKIMIHPAAVIMIHEPGVATFGTADALRETANALDQITSVYVDAYAAATGNNRDLIAGWMKAETWMTAAEAVEFNFCDLIEGDTPESVPVAAFDYSRFKSAPASLVELALNNGWAEQSPKKG